MEFLYPNLVAGTRTQKMSGIVPEDLGDGRVGYVLRNDGTAEKSMYMLNVTLHTGTDYVLSFWSENTTNMSGTKWCVINQATGALAAYHIFDSQGPGGGYLTEHFRLWNNAEDGAQYIVRFDNEGTTDGKTCAISFADIMLVEGTTPHAWAPAAGEVWP